MTVALHNKKRRDRIKVIAHLIPNIAPLIVLGFRAADSRRPPWLDSLRIIDPGAGFQSPKDIIQLTGRKSQLFA